MSAVGRGGHPGGRLAAAAAGALGLRNLVLVGFMGVGKSTLGQGAARALHRPFADTDALVERRAGRAIPAIFAAEGEEAFRALEAAAILQLTRGGGRVLATGGGALGRPGNLEALRANGLLVCLFARPEVILARVGGAAAAARRPLLAGGEAAARIAALLAARAPHYAAADLRLDTSDLPRAAAVQALLRLCAEGGRRRGGG